MSYGIEFVNDYGERVFNSNGLMFEKSSGTMDWISQNGYLPGQGQGAENGSIFRQYQNWGRRTFFNGGGGLFSGAAHRNWTDNYTWSDTAYGRYLGCCAQVVNNTFTSKYISSDPATWYQYVRHAIPNTTGQTLSDYQELFFELPSEGLHFFGTFRNPYNNFFDASCKGLKGLAMPHSDRQTGISYVMATTEKPTKDLSAHGLQIDDASGSEIYDTRYDEKAVRIKDHVYISSGDLYDVLFTGATKTYTLRQSVTTPYIGGSPFVNWRWIRANTGSSGRQVYRMSYPKLTVSGTTLTMSRTEYDEGGFGNIFGNVLDYSKYEGSTLMIADMS